MYEPYKLYLSVLHSASKYRRLLAKGQENQNNYLDFSTNDYLGLSRNSEILNAAILAAQQYGIGSTGSRLLSGNNELFESLESLIAKDKNTESALIFNTGFQTNLSVLSSLLDSKILASKPIVFFDKLNHASLYQAISLSCPELVRFHHNDMEHLSSLLIKYENDNRPKFIVTETVFGMDGTILPIKTLVSLAKQYKTFLYLDEAHATGIYGPNGYGLSTNVDLRGIPFVIMGTFSKALGCSGGYVACDQILKDYLINNAQGFIYSTANSPFVIGAAYKAWEIIRNLNEEREHLFSLSAILRNNLMSLGFDIGASASHIIPIIYKEEKLALAITEKLCQKGIIVSCIRPPTVPLNSARIRIALNSNHKKSDIEKLITELKTL